MWQQLKDELKEIAGANVTATTSPVRAVIQEVEDLRWLLREFDEAVTQFVTCDYDSYETLEETYRERLRKLMTVQSKVRELIG